jgi:hypothetical protein
MRSSDTALSCFTICPILLIQPRANRSNQGELVGHVFRYWLPFLPPPHGSQTLITLNRCHVDIQKTRPELLNEFFIVDRLHNGPYS